MRLALTGVCRSESPWLAEWIAYHRLLGFDHIHLGCNDPKDSDEYVRSKAVAQPYIDMGVLSWHDWPDKPGRRTSGAAKRQHEYYDFIIHNNKKRHDWMAVLDVDEYLVSSHPDLKELIETLYAPMENLAGVCCKWRLFGSGGLETVQGELQTEKLVYHIPAEVPVAKHSKSIFRLDRVGPIANPHEPKPKAGFRLISAGDGMTPEKWKPLCVNHYFCRGPQDFKRKIAFGRFQGMRQMTEPERWRMWNIYNDAATAVDTSMAVWADRIREAIANPK